MNLSYEVETGEDFLGFMRDISLGDLRMTCERIFHILYPNL
jgi:hypothetical protein